MEERRKKHKRRPDDLLSGVIKATPPAAQGIGNGTNVKREKRQIRPPTGGLSFSFIL
jgi:hypothetical protein